MRPYLSGAFVAFIALIGVPASASASDIFVVRATNQQQVDRFSGSTGAFEATVGQFTHVTGSSLAASLTFGPDGLLYGLNQAKMARFDVTTGVSELFFDASADFSSTPMSFTFGPDGDIYWAAVGNQNEVRRYDGTTGAFEATIGQFALGQSGPYWGDLTFGPDGMLYIQGGVKVHRMDPTTGATSVFIDLSAELIPTPVGFTFGPDDKLYWVMASNSGEVRRYDGATGAFETTIGQFLINSGSNTGDLAFGPDGMLYLHGQSRISRMDVTTGQADVFINLSPSSTTVPVGFAISPEVAPPAIPEPATGAVFVAGLFAIARRRR